MQWRIEVIVEFIYTNIFERRWKDLNLDDTDARALEIFLSEKPDRGDVIQGTDGLRKVRWKTEGRGKRGGIRVI